MGEGKKQTHIVLDDDVIVFSWNQPFFDGLKFAFGVSLVVVGWYLIRIFLLGLVLS